MTSRRFIALVATAGLAIGACGGGSDAPAAGDRAAGNPPTAPTDGPSDSTPVATPDASTPTTSQDDDPPTSAPATSSPSPSTAPPPASTSGSPTTVAPPPTASTTAPAAADDGCSTDGSPTPLEVAGRPIPDLPVASGSEGSPFPELAVRRLNCDGGWVQLKDEIPADTPVLAWFWAPH